MGLGHHGSLPCKAEPEQAVKPQRATSGRGRCQQADMQGPTRPRQVRHQAARGPVLGEATLGRSSPTALVGLRLYMLPLRNRIEVMCILSCMRGLRFISVLPEYMYLPKLGPKSAWGPPEHCASDTLSVRAELGVQPEAVHQQALSRLTAAAKESVGRF